MGTCVSVSLSVCEYVVGLFVCFFTYSFFRLFFILFLESILASYFLISCSSYRICVVFFTYFFLSF